VSKAARAEAPSRRPTSPRIRWRRPAGAGLVALLFGVLTARGRGRDLDRAVYRRLNGTGGRGTDAFFRAVTEFGSIWCSAGAAAVVARSGRRREAADAVGAAMAMWLVGQGLKKLFARPRPYDALEEFRLMIGEPRGTSWPSSHPGVLLAFLTVAARDLDLSPEARAGTAVLASTVGASRVYLGVHYPADVASGLLLGRGVGDLWSAIVSPRVLGRPPVVEARPFPPRVDTVTGT
jgi:hypothetical protein